MFIYFCLTGYFPFWLAHRSGRTTSRDFVAQKGVSESIWPVFCLGVPSTKMTSSPSSSSSSRTQLKPRNCFDVSMALIFIFVLMFLESDNVSSSEASATKVDIMDGVRNFRPRQVRTVERGFCF